MDKKLISDEEFGEMLGWTTKTIYNRLAKGESMPPFHRIPNARSRLWRLSDINDWLESHKTTNY